jgi:hypothetical protein
MNFNTQVQDDQPNVASRFVRQLPRFRAGAQAGVIVTLGALVLLVAALSGCDGAGSISGTAHAKDVPAAQAQPTQTGFDWRKAVAVDYVPADWETPDEARTY